MWNGSEDGKVNLALQDLGLLHLSQELSLQGLFSKMFPLFSSFAMPTTDFGKRKASDDLSDFLKFRLGTLIKLGGIWELFVGIGAVYHGNL